MSTHVHGGDVYRYENYLDFSSNCNPLGTPRQVQEAVEQAAGSLVHYPDVRCAKLKSALSAFEAVPEEQLICGNGAAELIFSLCLARKPAKALLLAPTFAEYEQALRSVGCEVLFHTLKREADFIPDASVASDIRDQQPDLVFFCNPNNPTGVLSDRSLLIQILEACESVEALLVVDECFLDFVREPAACTMKTVLPDTDALFILKAFTKRYAMAGVRLGYGMSRNGALLNRMEEVTQPWNVSSPAQAAGIAALGLSEYVKEGRQMVFTEREFLKKEMETLGLHVYEPSANYLFFEGPEGLCEALRGEKILIRDCSNYRTLRPGDYRVAVRTHEENKKLLAALKSACHR